MTAFIAPSPLGVILNVKASQIQVDNSTDDTGAWNTQLRATPSAGASFLEPVGTSIISAALGNSLPNNPINIGGLGRDVSILKLANASNASMFDDNFSTSNVTIRDLTFDGNKANQTAGTAGIQFEAGAKHQIFNVRVRNTWGKGIYLFSDADSLILASEVESSGKTPTSDQTGAAIGINGSRIRVIGNRIDSPNDSGIAVVNNSSDITLILGNTVHNPSFGGISGGAPPPNQNFRLSIVANGVDGAINSHGIDVGGAQDVTVAGNVVNSCFGGLSSDSGGRVVWVGNVIRAPNGTGGGANGNGLIAVGQGVIASNYLNNNAYVFGGNLVTNANNHGIAWDSARGEIVIANNILKNNAQTIAGAVGIRLVSTNAPMGNALVIGNKAYDDQNVKTQAYGLEIASNTYHTYALHNDFRGNLTGAIHDSGVATYTHGNLGYNPRGFLVAPAPALNNVILYNPFNCDCMVYINGSSGAALTAVAVGGIAAPVNATHIAIGTGGTLANNTAFFYRVSALNPQGETLASTETSITTPAGPNTCSVVVKWVAVPGATGYNVYGRTTGGELKMVSNVQATAWLDDGSVTPSGALPGGDTTGNTAITGWTAAPAADSVIGIYLPWGNGIKLTYTTFVTANWQWFGI